MKQPLPHENPTPGAFSKVPLVPMVLACILGAAAFGPGLVPMVQYWFYPQGYYGHGPLVLVAVLWVVWDRRKALREVEVTRGSWGLLWMLFSLLTLALGLVENVHILQYLAFYLALVGSSLVLLGGPIVKKLWFAYGFLLAMIPLPPQLIEIFTFKMKLLAAQLSVAAIHLLGYVADLHGSTIRLSSASVVVDDVCSGLRTLITLLVMAVFVAYLQRTRWKAILMVVLSVPIAIAANVARIMALCALANMGSRAAFRGPLHEGVGLATYAVALVLLLAIQALPDSRRRAKRDGMEPTDGATGASGSPTDAVASQPPPAVPPTSIAVPALLVLLALGTTARVAHAVHLARMPPFPRNVTQHVPKTVGPWTGSDSQLGRKVRGILGTEDLLLRRFRREGSSGTTEVFMVYTASDKTHPPDFCYIGSGHQELERGLGTLTTGTTVIEANRFLFKRGGQNVLVYYWYRVDRTNVASYFTYRWSSALRRLRGHRGACMIRLTATTGPDGIQEAEDRLAVFANEALDAVLDPIP
ncbi:exosortase C-terminal domain/associated protein EpsI [Planctomycetota bacterium]